MTATGTERRPRWGVAPYFLVNDVVATSHYYRDKLGFGYDRFWGDPPAFCMVHRSGVVLMLSQLDATRAMQPNHLLDPDRGAWDAYVWVDDADALHAEYLVTGVTIVHGLCDQAYGCRDFEIEDCNGFRIAFGHEIRVATAG